MKLETIKAAIKEWYEVNDYIKETQFLLNEGVIFQIDPKVKLYTGEKEVGSEIYIHAYPSVIYDKLKFILINSEMDKLEKFEDKRNPITQYIYVADVVGMDSDLASEFLRLKEPEPNDNTMTPQEAKERILRWSLIKDEWIVNQVNNTEGVFEVFVIPDIDLKADSDIYAFLALKNDAKADLIIMDKHKQTNKLRILNSGDDELYDVVTPCPPYGDETMRTESTNGKTDKSNFFLLNISTQ